MPDPVIPEYPNHGRDCRSVGQAIAYLLDLGVELSPIARVYYVKDQNSYYLHRDDATRGNRFSVHFFSTAGREVGSYSLIVERFQFHSGTDGKGRVWGSHLEPHYAAESIENEIEWYHQRKARDAAPTV